VNLEQEQDRSSPTAFPVAVKLALLLYNLQSSAVSCGNAVLNSVVIQAHLKTLNSVSYWEKKSVSTTLRHIFYSSHGSVSYISILLYYSSVVLPYSHLVLGLL